MKKQRKVFHLPNSPKAKSLQRFKELWRTNPESMELRRKRGVEKWKRNCNKYKDELWNYFVNDNPEVEISPESLNRICYYFIKEKRNRGKWTKLKSFRRFLTKNNFIKYDFERDLYLNCYKIDRLEEIRLETEQRKAEAEARRKQEEARRLEPKPPQAHRETQHQQVGQALDKLEELKKNREACIEILRGVAIKLDKNSDPAFSEHLKVKENKFRNKLEELDLEISKLENCGEKLGAKNCLS